MFCHPKSECSPGITFLILTTAFHDLVTVFQTPTASLFCFSSREVEVIGSYFVTPLIVSSLVSYSYLRFCTSDIHWSKNGVEFKKKSKNTDSFMIMIHSYHSTGVKKRGREESNFLQAS